MRNKIAPIPTVELIKDPLLRAILVAFRENMKLLSGNAAVSKTTVSTVSGRNNTPATVEVTPEETVAGGSGGGTGSAVTLRAATTRVGQTGLPGRSVSLGIVCDEDGDAMLDARGQPLFSIDYGVLA